MRIVDIKGLAEQLNTSERIVRAAVKAGRIPVLHLTNKTVRFDLDAVRARLAEGNRHEVESLP
jgi:predicted site-specific integrase-resolvase